jgi:molecular chaperone DnaJ
VEQDIDNAFAELGLRSGATEPEVKAAWRRLVSQWHPDRNDSAVAVAKMQRINRAVEAIRRAGFHATARSSAGTGGPKAATRPEAPPQRDDDGGRAGAHSTEEAQRADPGEFDEDAESAAPHAAGASTRTINRKVRLTLEEAAFGCTKVLRGRVTDACSSCEGAGYRVLGGHCSQCHGSGAVRERSWFGWVGTQTECEACHGGGIARQPCGACEGSGKAAAQRYQVTVRFPHGVRDGDLLTVPGRRGKPGSPPGELNIRVDIQHHDLLRLDEDGSLRCEVLVDGFAWIANRPVEVPVLGGSQTIQLRRDQLHHRLEGQGFPIERRGPRGDQWITILPVFPQRMSTDQQILLDQLIATTSGPNEKQADDRLQQWNQKLRTWKGAGRRRT